MKNYSIIIISLFMAVINNSVNTEGDSSRTTTTYEASPNVYNNNNNN